MKYTFYVCERKYDKKMDKNQEIRERKKGGKNKKMTWNQRE